MTDLQLMAMVATERLGGTLTVNDCDCWITIDGEVALRLCPDHLRAWPPGSQFSHIESWEDFDLLIESIGRDFKSKKQKRRLLQIFTYGVMALFVTLTLTSLLWTKG